MTHCYPCADAAALAHPERLVAVGHPHHHAAGLPDRGEEDKSQNKIYLVVR